MKNVLSDKLQEEMVRLAKERINGNKQIMELRKEYAMLVMNKKYIQASNVQKKIKQLSSQIQDEFFGHCETERISVDGLLTSFSEEDLEEWNLKINAIIFLCDMIERMQMDCNSLMEKYHPNCSFEMFDSIINTGKKAAEQVSFMSKMTENVYQTNFGDYADDMYELVINKCKAFTRRMSYVNELQSKQKL